MAWELTQSPRRGNSFVVEETFPEAQPACVWRGGEGGGGGDGSGSGVPGVKFIPSLDPREE